MSFTLESANTNNKASEGVRLDLELPDGVMKLRYHYFSQFITFLLTPLQNLSWIKDFELKQMR
jgi:hypothetical protein